MSATRRERGRAVADLCRKGYVAARHAGLDVVERAPRCPCARQLSYIGTRRRIYQTRKMLALTPRRPLRQIVRSLTTTATAVHVHPDGITVPALHTCFPHLWLRDTCQCPRCIHPSTRQKYHRLSDVPIDVRPISVRLTASVLATPASTDRTLAIDWTDGHVSQHPLSLLTRYSSPAHLSAFHRDTPRTPWSSSTFSQVPDQVLPYEALAKPAGLLSALTQLIRYGILFLTGVPTTYVNDDSRSCCETSKLAQMLGEIRPTFYGEMWDVKNIVDSRNIAYTDLDLGLHVDLSCVFTRSHFIT